MKVFRNSIFLLFITLLVACSKYNGRIMYTLEYAGSNRVELEKVLEHYKDSNLKYRAACFLIENMPKYYSYKGWLLDTLRYWKATTDSFGSINNKEVVKWEKYPLSTMDKVYDVHVITADYLIRNIEQAFEVWNKRSWNKNLSFEDFCELILPYRIGNETLEEWRSLYYKEFSFLLDSVYTDSDVVEAVNVISRHLRKRGFQFNIDFNTPHMGATFLLDKRVGKCVDSCDFMLYVMRSLGIPVATDCYVYSPESRMGHTWNVVRDTTGKYINFGFFEANRSSRELDGKKMGKVYRYCYAAQQDKIEYLKFDNEVPPLFQNCYLKDVSREYFENIVELDLGKMKSDYIYLGLFHSHQAGEGVDMAEMRNGKVCFHNVEPQMVYIPLIYENSVYKPAGYPFLFDGTNICFYEPNLLERDTVTLWRKNTFFQWVKDCLNTVVGGKFSVSNRKDFFHSNPFYIISDTPQVSRTVVHLSMPFSGRYVQYSAASNIRTEIAELSFQYNGTPIEALGVEGYLPENELRQAENIIDGDPLSYFRSLQEGASIIVDFGKEISFNEIVYMPKNDDNFIRIGDVYELFYHNGKQGWVSLGRKTAIDTFLVYDNMPKGALFYLHDITRGKEEQVFHIKNGKQFFISNVGT